MERNLVTSAEDADYVIDLSNVVRERSFGGPARRSLRRAQLVVQALVKMTRDPGVLVYLVADVSLLGGHREFADQAEVRRLRRWVANGLVEEVGDADERVLEIAGMTGIPVVSGDHYVKYRDEHLWIQGDSSRFLKPTPGPGDTVTLVPIDMGVRSAAEISRRQELDALKMQGLLSSSRKPLIDVLTRSWRCPERRCVLYDVGKGGRVLPPRMRDGVPTCQQHGTPLVDAGPRPGAAQIKAVVDGSVVARYTLAEGSETSVGRYPEPGIALFELLNTEVVGRVSREHVIVSVKGGVVLVRDVSSFGTRMRRADRKGRLGTWEQLSPRVDRRFHPGDEVELTDGVVLTRSGRLFPAELPAAWQNVGPPVSVPPGAVTPTVRA